MWLVTTRGFYSAIRWHDGRICIRARATGDLERLKDVFPTMEKIEVSPLKDYRYRTWVTPKEFKKGMARLADDVTYGNFKSEVERVRPTGNLYPRILHRVWSLFGDLQPGGPYGSRSTGYPPVPKKEAKVEAAARKARREQLTLGGWSSRGHVTLPEGEPGEEVECEDCGHVGVARTMDWYGNGWRCKDVQACLDRALPVAST